MFKVFVVDDEPFIIEGLHHIVDWQEFGLEIAGFAYDGRQALDMLRALKVDVLITDISMPEMNGLELIRELRADQPELKIIVLSGFNEFDYLKEGMKYGIENYLLKPINVHELKETLRVAVDKLHTTDTRRWSDNDIGILRENILFRWVTGRISFAELKERTALLHIDISAPFFMASVIRCPVHSEEGHQAIADAMQGGSATVFRDFDGYTVLLFALADRDEARRKALAEIETLRAELPQFQLRITAGRAQPTTSGAAESYAEALTAHEYFLIHPEDETIDCGQLNGEVGEDGSDRERREHREKGHSFAFPWPDYVKRIHAGDAEGLERRIAEDMDQLRSVPGMTPVALRSAVAGLLQLFHSELKSEAQADQHYLHLEELDQVAHVNDIDELIAIVQEVARRLLADLDREGKSPVIAGVLDRIHAAYHEPLSLKQLGREFNVHPAYLGQLFQKEMGVGFTDYMNRYRIGKAKQLLRESHYKVHEIAQLVGYVETGYFYKNFKKYVGISPLDYKEMI